jgi:hypothetical protein
MISTMNGYKTAMPDKFEKQYRAELHYLVTVVATCMLVYGCTTIGSRRLNILNVKTADGSIKSITS